ncbi:MAG: extracellular solute-binding protein [Sphaerochaetaceae bacterium]|jgi:multiple sugar transport system substrate-binding protein|nr:extracellular solute-binding protein [Sphaerochaetaceae bacterium]MDD2407033.1 extracellular solute-binding protein [Sphaerochaetaceae bacterium]MDD3670846.1 extracellular solute-binding protein [Sphaerochaetaceae bacterium]MDD4841595.1 extracellular solute-binding protein [Sphaerochaetaceae bacterium]NLO61032.1 extracellular solute-binding protein [Spirochaetales bacterium]
MKKITLLLVCTLLIATTGLLFAQGAAEPAATGEKEKIVWVAYGYLAENKADRIIADFEAKYPQYDVEYVDLGSTDYIMRLDTMIAAGDRVDMALTLDSIEYTKRAKEGMFLPIEKYLTEDGFDLLDGFGDGIKASYINDELYGLPYTKGGFYIFYNKDMFDAAKVAYPTDDWTWADFEKVSKALTKGDGANKIYGANIHLTWGYDIDTLPAQMAGWTPFKDGNPKVANMTDQRLKDALAMWHRMQNVDKSAISLATFKAEQIASRMPFAQGDAAMLLSNWWSASWFISSRFGSAEGAKILDFNVGVVNLPRPNASVPNNLNATDLDYYFAVPITSKNPKGGALLARFMVTEMWSKLGTLSSYRHQDLEAFKKNFVTFTDTSGTVHTMNYSDDFVQKVMGGWTVPITSYYNIDTKLNPTGLNLIKDIFGQERELYYLGEQDLNATVAAMQKRAQAALDSIK